MLNQTKNRKVAAALAFAGVVAPVPLAGLHKFYLGRPGWGIVYLLLWFTQISRVASAVEGVWYLWQDDETFERNFNLAGPSVTIADRPASNVDPKQIGAIAEALRQLDQLRQDGLISEYEFEQKRRVLLDKMN